MEIDFQDLDSIQEKKKLISEERVPQHLPDKGFCVKAWGLCHQARASFPVAAPHPYGRAGPSCRPGRGEPGWV